MRELGMQAYQAERAASGFRRRDEQSILELGSFDEGSEYLDRAKSYIQQLEQQMQEEVRKGKEPDPGWDVESLRADVKEMAAKLNIQSEK